MSENKMCTIICDGGKRKGIAYGSFIIYNPKGKIIIHKGVTFAFGTSNLAEYETLIRALHYATALGITEVEIKMDSLLVINQVLGKFRCNYKHLRLARGDVRSRLKNCTSWKFTKIHNTEMKSILGH